LSSGAIFILKLLDTIDISVIYFYFLLGYINGGDVISLLVKKEYHQYFFLLIGDVPSI